MRQRWIAMSSCLAIGITFWAVSAQERLTRSGSVAEDQQSTLMLAKLASSQTILDGLVSNDFAQIRRGAQDLNRICQAFEWVDTDDQVYQHHRTELHRLTQKLLKTADDRNLDGASFTYMHSLTVCISCHQHCRDVLKLSDFGSEDSEGKVVPIPVNETEAIRIYEEPVRR